MVILKRLLDRPERPIRIRHPLNRRNLRPVSSRRQHVARLNRIPVHMNNTRPALTRVAPNMRPRKSQMLTQKINKQSATLNIPAHTSTVNNQTDR